MANHIIAKEYAFWDLMSGEFIFNIPDYQRPYSWTENEVSALWEDLIEFWNRGYGSNNQTYFLGSVVLVKGSHSPEVEVIDGQQRLTTLSILLSLLKYGEGSYSNDIKKCLWEEGIQHKHIEGRPRINLRKRDASFFQKYIAEESHTPVFEVSKRQVDDDAQRLIINNAKLLNDKIHSELHCEAEIDSFVQTLFNGCYFVVVTTPDNESAFRVFSVLNNRGLSLLPSDIIKAHIIGRISYEQRQYFTNKWEDIEVDLGREDFNSLLSHIRMIYARNKLHGTLVEEFEQKVFTAYNDKEALITEVIEPYARAYKVIKNLEYTSSYKAEAINDLLSWLCRIDDSDWIPVEMYVLANYGGESDKVFSITHSLERLASYFYITSKTSNQRIERYSKALEKLQKKQVEEALQIIELSSAECTEFLDALDGDIYLLPARKRKYVILRLDRFMSDKAANYNNNLFSIEHILPQNPKENSQWVKDWKDEETRDYWMHKIANLVPLTRKKNSQAQNYDFKTKKEKYFTDKHGITTYALTTDIIHEKEWTPLSLQCRQKRLVTYFATNWQLSPAKKQGDVIEEEVVETTFEEDAEIIMQERLLKEIDRFFISNPNTKLPRLPKGNMKVGKFVQTAIYNLSVSGFELKSSQINKLCTVEGSIKYTRRNLPFLLPVKQDVKGSNQMQRYWKSKIITFNGEEFYVFSQWYPDHKISKDAHRSDFLRLYIDLAKNQI